MEQDLKALEVLSKMAMKTAKTKPEKSTVSKYKRRLELILNGVKPSVKFKIMIVTKEGQIMWGKERIGFIEPIEDESKASFFTRDEAEYIETVMLQNGKIKIYRVGSDG